MRGFHGKKRNSLHKGRVIIWTKHIHCFFFFFAVKLNLQYFYLDKLQNSIPLPLLSSLFFSPFFLSFHVCVHYLKARYGCYSKRQTKAY